MTPALSSLSISSFPSFLSDETESDLLNFDEVPTLGLNEEEFLKNGGSLQRLSQDDPIQKGYELTPEEHETLKRRVEMAAVYLQAKEKDFENGSQKKIKISEDKQKASGTSFKPETDQVLEIPQHLLINGKWLFKGTQNEGRGGVSVSKVEKIRAKLESQSALGIEFNPKKVTDRIEGGTSSAMSLEFLNVYFKTKEIILKKSDSQSNLLLSRLMGFAEEFSASSEYMRNLQAAFNTIEVRKLDRAVDYSKNKMQSLANYHSFVIDYSSKEMKLYKNIRKKIVRVVSTLPEGAFLVRLLKSAKNEKLEAHGHTMVYIREKGIRLFYDPNFGARCLTPSEHNQVLFNSFKKCCRVFQKNKARF